VGVALLDERGRGLAFDHDGVPGLGAHLVALPWYTPENDAAVPRQLLNRTVDLVLLVPVNGAGRDQLTSLVTFDIVG
jgi:hypothetical protein